MNFKSLITPAALALIGFVTGCSGSSSAPDPTSREALNKAPPMKWGSTCTEHEIQWVDTSRHEKRTPICEDSGDCAAVEPGSVSIAGASLLVTYEDPGYFEGTCSDPRPISCDDRPRKTDCDACQYEQCCTFIALCEDDPNCTAATACVVYCKDDKDCVERCRVNADYEAFQHLAKALECVEAKCKDRC